MNPDFVALMPVHNAGNDIDGGIESILKSIHENFLLLCFDDHSSDDTARRIRAWEKKDSRIVLAPLPENHRRKSGTPLGFERSVHILAYSLPEVPFLFFVRPQDRVSPYFMASSLDMLRKHDPDAVYCRTLPWNGNDSDFPVPPDFRRTERIATDPEDKSWFMRHDALQGIVFQRQFYIDHIFDRKMIGSGDGDGGAGFRLGNEMFVQYKNAAYSRKLAENPDAVYFFRSDRPDRFPFFPRIEDYDLTRCRDFALSYRTHFDQSRDLLQKAGFRMESFCLFELDFLIRLHRRLTNDPSREDASDLSGRFAEIAENFDEETRDFFRNANLSPSHRNFVQNIMGVGKFVRRKTFPRRILRESEPGPVRSSAVDPEVYFENDSLRVLSWNVGKGKLGINESGYETAISVLRNGRGGPSFVLSAHCPSTVHVDVKKPIAVSGMLDGSSDCDVYSPCRFFVSKKNIGSPISPSDRTGVVILEPGMHELKIRSMDPKNKRSLWLFEENPEISPDSPYEDETTFCPFRPAPESETKKIGILQDRPLTDTLSVLRSFALRSFLESSGYETKIIRPREDEGGNPPDGAPDSMQNRLRETFERFYREHVETPGRNPAEVDGDESTRYGALVLTGRLDGPTAGLALNSHENELDGVRRIGFSLSFSSDNKTEERRKAIRSRIERLSVLSVLDDGSAEAVRNSIGSKPSATRDPLFLLGREQWDLLAGEMNPEVKPYLLVHLHDANPEAVAVAARLAAFFGCEIILASPKVLPDDFLDDAARTVHRRVAVAPQAFLGLLRHAKFVVADSYCATIFSVIYRKPFITMTRQVATESDVAEISGLLEPLGLENQWVRLEESTRRQMQTELPFDEIETKIRIESAESAEFLLGALERKASPKNAETFVPSAPEPSDRKFVRLPGREAVASPLPMTTKFPNPDFTVGITAYNLDPYIDDAVASVLRSTYKNFRLVVSDNRSTDGTYEKLERWAKKDSRIVLLRNRTNIGVQGNTGVVERQMNTPYGAWLDGDDMISPYYMETVKREFERHDVDGIFFQTVFIDENGRYMHGGTDFGRPSALSGHPAEKAFYFCRPAASYKIWNRLHVSRMLKTAFYYADPVRAHMDVYSNIYSIAGSRKILEIPEALYYRRIRAGSVTQRTADESQLDAVVVYESSKKFLLRSGRWNDYKESFLRYKLNHLMWLYGHIAGPYRDRLISMVAENMDQEERWFYREAKFPGVQRNFIRQILKIADFQVASRNVFPESVSWTPDMSGDEETVSKIPENAKRSGTCFENDFLAVHSWDVGTGRLGIDASGVGGPLVSPPEFSDGSHAILGASCPSRVHVSFKRPVVVSGFMNGTTRWSANTNCLFTVSETSLGFLSGPGERTPERLVEPGFYVLKTDGIDPPFKHSAWAIRQAECEKIRIETQDGAFSQKKSKTREKKRKKGK